MQAALVPAKELGQAKARLNAVLSYEQRRALSVAMLADVLAALRACPSLRKVALVSRDDQLLRLGRQMGALSLPEPGGMAGLNDALTFARGELVTRAVDTLLVIPADLPLLTREDIETLLREIPRPRGALVVPARDRGTNALALRPPFVIPFRFGPSSADAHAEEAARVGLPCRILSMANIALDIDTPADLEELSRRRAGPRTAGLLRRLPLPFGGRPS